MHTKIEKNNYIVFGQTVFRGPESDWNLPPPKAESCEDMEFGDKSEQDDSLVVVVIVVDVERRESGRSELQDELFCVWPRSTILLLFDIWSIGIFGWLGVGGASKVINWLLLLPVVKFPLTWTIFG